VNRTYIALSKQLACTAQFIQLVLAGRSSDEALAQCPANLRPSTQALGFAALRNLHRAQTLIGLMARQKQAPEVQSLLLTALALLSNPHAEASATYDTFTLVNQAVEAAKANKATRHASGFINACLRRFLREKDALLTEALQQEPARWNHPAWWIRRMQKDYPQDWQDLLYAAHCKAPMVLRAHLAPGTTERSSPTSHGQALPAKRVGEFAWALDAATPVDQIDGFNQGLFSVQDAAAQLAAPLLLRAVEAAVPAQGRRRPLRILDACAAPGGKTVHLLQFASVLNLNVQVTALDIDAQRCERIRENLQRCGLSAEVKAVNAAQPPTWWDGQTFDGILLDAPCSASGIVRRHPDVPWLRRESDIGQLARIQQQLLDALWPLLSPQGVLLYCTCSQFKAEGVDQAQSFVARNTQAQLLPSPGHLLGGLDRMETLLPENRTHDVRESALSALAAHPMLEHDGFFYALFASQPLDFSSVAR
jgi:16S rRNA (cytosine967-C5)-methyltransferase